MLNILLRCLIPLSNKHCYNLCEKSRLKMSSAPEVTEQASFGMACFWAPDAQFGCVPGILLTNVGYAGGTTPNPTYRAISDHTETIQLTYDPKILSYGSLLELFWKFHDATECNKRQYTSVIFYHSEDQKKAATKSLESRKSVSSKTIYTQVLPVGTFYEAEGYHQKHYLQKHPFILKELEINPEDLVTSTLCCRLNGLLSGYESIENSEKQIKSLGLKDSVEKYIREQISEGIEQD